jgi:predicted MPP superfamily phosphohydrolase
MNMKKTRIVLRAAAVLGVVITCFGFFYYCNNDDNLNVTRYEYLSEKYTGNDDFRIVQLSDFHNHSLKYKNADLVQKILDLKPDVIVCTGDFIDNHTRDYGMMESLAASWKEKGIPMFYVDGNHERKASEEITAKEHQIFDTWGKNLYKTRVDLGNGIVLSGVRDPGSKSHFEGPYFKPYEGDVPAQLKDLEAGFNAAKFNIMLCHRPDLFYLMVEKGYDLTYSGHTHGGQVILGGWAIAVYPWTEYIGGQYHSGSSSLVVNRGLGTSYNLPIRYRCEAEIVLTTIKKRA